MPDDTNISPNNVPEVTPVAVAPNRSEQVQDFLNPKSIITVTAASSLVVAITTTLNTSFGWQQTWVAMALSAIFALFQLSFLKEPLKLFTKGIYFVIVTLVIFNSARGGSGTLAGLAGNNQSVSIPTMSAPPLAALPSFPPVPVHGSPTEVGSSVPEMPPVGAIPSNPPVLAKPPTESDRPIFQKW